ncbi:FtsX-like permease family protein [Modestobacter sp. SYSU DS0290]
MLGLATAMARRRLAALVAVFCAVLGGAAIVTGTGVLMESGLRSELPAGRLAGADVLVAADQTVSVPEDLPIALPERAPLPDGLAGRLGDLPGVTSVTTDVSFPAALLAGDGAVVGAPDPAQGGHGWSSVGLLPGAEVTGAAPDGPGEVALGADLADAAGLAPGDSARVVVDGGRPVDVRVTAVVHPGGAGVLLPDDAAAMLRDDGPRAGTVDLIGLRVEPGTADDVAAAARRLVGPQGFEVATGDARGELVLPEAAAGRSLLVVLAGSLAGVPLLVVGFIVAGALSVGIAGQRRELALLRAVGTTPRQVRRLVATQASLVGAAAAVPGLALGFVLAGQLRRLLVHLGMLPAELPLTVSPLPALAALLLVLAVVQVAARSAAWRVSREPVTTALGESRTGPRTPSRTRTVAGLALLAAAVVLSVAPLLSRSVLGAAGASLAGLVAAIGLALAGPALLRAVTGRLARALPAGTSAPSWLAVANLHGYALRSAGAITTLAMAVVFTLTYAFSQTTVSGAAEQDAEAGTLADTAVAAPGLGGVPGDVAAAVAATPGVEAAAPVSATTVLLGTRLLGEVTVEAEQALVLTPDAAGVLDLGVRDGDLADLTGATVAVARGVADVGEELPLTLGDGTDVEPRVVAVYDRDLGFGGLAVSADLVAGHRTTDLADQVLVRTDGSPATADRLAALAGERAGVVVDDAAAGTEQGVPPEVWLNIAVIGVLLGYVLLGIANALVAATAQRRDELAALRLTGTTPAQVRSMMRREAGLVAFAAVAAGVLVSAVPLALLGIGFLGHPWPAGPWWLLPVTAAVVAAVAFAATEVPTRLALRSGPAETLARAT